MAQCAGVGSVGQIWLGRQRELADLEAGLDDLGAGRGGLYLVAGEPGIGKTRLCDELARAAAARGIAVHWGRAWEVGGAPSYWPFIQVLRGMCRGADPRTLPVELRELLGIGGGRGDVEAETREQFALFDAVATYLHAAAARAPQIVILDDLHAADPSSVRMLHFLVRDLRAHRLMVIGTYREAEARLLLEIGRTLAHVAREAVVLPLRRLDRREVGEYIARATGETPADDRVDALYQRTEGNPLFLRELLQLAGSTVRAPDGIREVVRARLSLLPPPLRATLEIGAVIGRELTVDVLAAVAEQTPGDIVAQLAPAADASILEPLEAGRWRFTHVLLREGLYEDLEPARRGALHRRVAEELRRRAGDPAELAHHLLHAMPAVSLAEVTDAALAAAERSVRMLAFEDAVAVLARVVGPLEQAPGEARRHGEVLLALGVARIRALDLAAGRETCVRAAAIARGLGDGELFARAVLGCACEYDPGLRNEALIAMLDEALAMLPPGDGALRARCLAQLAAERQPEPDTQPPLALVHEAVAMARRVGDPEALRSTLATVGLAMFAIEDPRVRRAINEEALRLAQEAHDTPMVMRLHLFLGLDHGELGDLAGALVHIQAYVTLAGARPTSRTRSILASMNAICSLWRGELAEAVRSADEIEALTRIDPIARDGIGGIALGVGLSRATERTGDRLAVEADLRAKFGAVHGELGACLGELLVCQLHASAGDRERAAAALARARALPVFARIREPAWLALLVEAVQLLGDTALAEALYPVLLPRADRFFTLGPMGSYVEPPYHRQLGQLARTLGRLDDAIAHLAEAEARTAVAGMRSHLAPLRTELASALLARGDRERAQVLLADARALAAELGQARTLAAIDALETGRPPVTPAPALDGDVPFTMEREGEYWTVTAGGKPLRLRDSRGLQLLAMLVERPGHELHVLQLVSPSDEGRDAGDAGEVLDDTAIQHYRTRLLALREQVEEAEGFGDSARAERAQEEIEALTQELARAVGLGGRARRAGGAAERARTTVQKRLRDAIRRIEDGLPELGRHLDQTVRTGMFCCYVPHGRRRR